MTKAPEFVLRLVRRLVTNGEVAVSEAEKADLAWWLQEQDLLKAPTPGAFPDVRVPHIRTGLPDPKVGLPVENDRTD